MSDLVRVHRKRAATSERNPDLRPSVTPIRDEYGVSPMVEEVLQSSGQPLDDQIRAFMEPRFGHDFSRVRVHTDNHATESARAVKALAYAVGRDVVFAAGQYQPETSMGRYLIAHELAHVIQQASGPVAGTSKNGNMTMSEPSDAFEQTADKVADWVTTLPPGTVGMSSKTLLPTAEPPQVSLQRQVDTQTSPPTQTQIPPAQVPEQNAPDPNVLWEQIETRATPELLIKLQEIGRCAGVQAKQEISDLFQPYEDSLEADRTFLEIVGIGPAGVSNLFEKGKGGWAGAGAQAISVVMNHILDFKSVGKVKTRASASIEDLVMTQITSGSDLYLSFESEALNELRQDFDQSWPAIARSLAEIPPEQRNATAVPMVVHWFSLTVRTKYGVESPAAKSMLAELRDTVAQALAPIKPMLDHLQEAQRWRRVGAGALGGAATGAGIGVFVGGPLGAAIGAGIGALAGAALGFFWP